LDDFGTGYAGLSWLQTIDFDVVKVDRSFLHQTDTREGALFLQDILRLLRNRGVSIVVEGVETEEQLAFLKQNKVPTAQGFHLARPVPAARLARV
jgi:EAL domain-containing protein (putative c-di-GMP-specific phosphodiesterase class I)